ncbi:RHS repeat-associated core domain-containing protein [Flavobacterium cupreum]|nr:RHS repeat-associated core domain-containing protein [Flavobacterium cupreum]
MKSFYFVLFFLLGLFVNAQTTPTGSSTEVGVTEGELSVSLSGAANYKIPIKVPPGINGVVPQINLVYNSQSGNGAAGYGWNIGGISTITRIPSTRFHNGNAGTITYSSSDNYALDGQRLLVKNGQQSLYGRNGTVYETENYSNVKVTSYGAISTNRDIGPEFFMAEYPDGSKAYYGYERGNNSNSRGAIHYAITYWENAQGLRISYSYFPHNNNTLNVASVKYGAKNDGTAPNEIIFTYTNKFKQDIQLIAGQQVRDDLLLTGIATKSSGAGFRNYTLSYDHSSLGYERLTALTEKTGDNSKSLNPTVFTYAENQTAYVPSMELTHTSVNKFTTEGIAQTLSGDFDGDGENELLLRKNGITVGEIADDYSVQEVSSTGLLSLGLPAGEFPGGIINVLDKDLKIPKNQRFYSLNVSNSEADYRYKIFNYNPDSKKVVLDYERTFHSGTTVALRGENQNTGGLFTGDFDGDNLTDVIRVHHEVNGVSQVEFFNFDRRVTSNFVTSIGSLPTGVKTFNLVPNVSNGLAVITGSSILQKGDINGDGKMDLILFRGSPYNDIKGYTLTAGKLTEIISWKQDLPGDLGSTFFQQHTAGINTTIAGTGVQRFPIVIGDYNGDGKSDILLVALKKVLIATAGIYFTEEFLPASFPALVYPYTVSFMSVDSNNDGRSDIVRLEPKRTEYKEKYTVQEMYQSGGKWYVRNVQTYRYNYDYGIKIDSYYRPGVNAASWNSFGFDKMLQTYKNDTDPSNDNAFNYVQLATIKKKNILNTELALIGAAENTGSARISIFSCTNYVSDQHLLSSITLGNGVKENLTYSALKNGNGVYEAGSPQLYPNLSIQYSPEFKVVSQIDYPNNGPSKKIFRYYGAMLNVEGLGFLGFQATMRTNRYDHFDTAIISTVSKNNFLLRGANVENYSVEGMVLPSAETPASFISQSKLRYNRPEEALQPNKVFKLVNIATADFDGLAGIRTETTTAYNATNNPTKITSVVKDAALAVVQKTETDVEYQDSAAGPYLVGRPKSKKQTIFYNGDVATSEEVYSYNPQQLLSQVKKRADATTSYIIEDNSYDLFGNIISKKITAGPNSRTASWAYDTSGRFLTAKTDIESLRTTFIYYPNGTLHIETNPYGQTATYEYDAWFRKTKATNYLGKTITYAYSNFLGNTITATAEDGSATMETFDGWGRKVREGSKNSTGNFSFVYAMYDIYDRKYKVSEPYFGNVPRQWNETKYDSYGRVTENISFTGKTTKITYSGLRTTVNDGTKSKTTVKDAIGNVVGVTDTPGGTINYSYYANGNLKETDYDGIKTSILQDKWGRKTRLVDPSAGIIKYTYNDFDELIKEENSNGITNYKLNAFGKPEEKTITGPKTNSKTTYVYNPATKLLTGSTFTDFKNGSTTISNSYVYDNWQRVHKVIETTPYATFTKIFGYDAFGRVSTETYTAATTTGKTSSKTITKTYKNGSPYQIRDNATVLWQTDNISPNGSLLSGTYGNGIKVTNSYNDAGYINSKDFSLGTTSILKLETSFDPQTGNLKNRKNSLFNFAEDFNYDSLDRLTATTTTGQFLNSTFSTHSTEGYQTEKGKLSVSGGSLVAEISDSGVAVKKTLLTGKAIGDQITLTFDLRKFVGSDLFIAYIQEQDPVTLEKVKIFKATLTSSKTITINHTVTKYSDLTLLIEKTSSPAYNVIQIDNVIGLQKSTIAQGYDDKGRITSNEQGVYTYSTSGKVYQHSSVDLTAKALPYYQAKPAQIITYTAFNSPEQIEETGLEKVSFNYNDHNERSTMFYGGVQDKLLRPNRKHYSADGTMEIKENKTTGAVEFTTYIGGDGYTAPVVFRSDGGSNQNYLYLHRDYQGSIVAITNQSGSVVEKRLFDAWGSIQKVQNGAGMPLSGLTILDRGYTGHEHIQSVGLINMNGRIYDPNLHCFLQPDNNIQDPFNTQNYNRYGYVLNNPLKYTDPSGEFINVFLGYLLSGYIIGAYASGGELNPAKWNSSAFISIGAAGASAGASAVATNLTNNYLDNYNKPPVLGFSAVGSGNDIHSFVGSNSSVGAPVSDNNSNVVDWYGPVGKVNWGFATASGIGTIKGTLNSERMYADGIRRGLLGNYPLTGRNLSLFRDSPMTKATIPISKVGQWAGIIGKGSFYFGLAMDGFGILNYLDDPNSPNAVHPAKAGLNTIMGAMGTYGSALMTVPSTLYFGIDAFYPKGWGGLAIDQERLYRENKAINPNYQAFPGAMKF